MKKTLLLAGLMAANLAQAADDIDSLQNLPDQAAFRDFSEDLGAALSYKALTPAEPTGITGFDVGLEYTNTELSHPELFDLASSGSGVSSLPLFKAHVHKGLPMNLDVGFMLSQVPDSNIELTGAELRYALLEGGIASPALAVRGTYSKLTGVDQLDIKTTGYELTLSKGVAMLTPYMGIGRVYIDSTPHVAGLSKEEFSLDKYYFGVNINLGLLNVVVESDKTGDASTIGGKVGFRF